MKYIKRFVNKLLYHWQLRIYFVHPKPHLKFMEEYFKDKRVVGVEIGVLRGWGAVAYLKSRLNIKKLWLVDHYKPCQDYPTEKENSDNFQAVCRNVLRNKQGADVIHLCPFSSDHFFNKRINLNKQQFDFVYLDGDHSYKQVLKDMCNAWRVLKKKGILAGDDLNRPGVLRAVIKFSQKIKKDPQCSERDWWFIK